MTKESDTREALADADPVIEVARAIAEQGFGRPWDDFLPLNAHDTDQGDLIEYAQAAISAIRQLAVSVVWQYRVMRDLGHKRQDEWCDWHETTKEGYERILAEIAAGNTRIEVRALGVVQ